eukprot:gene23499-biopygen22316
MLFSPREVGVCWPGLFSVCESVCESQHPPKSQKSLRVWRVPPLVLATRSPIRERVSRSGMAFSSFRNLVPRTRFLWVPGRARAEGTTQGPCLAQPRQLGWVRWECEPFVGVGGRDPAHGMRFPPREGGNGCPLARSVICLCFQRAFLWVRGRVFRSGMAFSSFRNLVARSPSNSGFGGPWPGPGATKQGPCLAQPRQVRRLETSALAWGVAGTALALCPPTPRRPSAATSDEHHAVATRLLRCAVVRAAPWRPPLLSPAGGLCGTSFLGINNP